MFVSSATDIYYLFNTGILPYYAQSLILGLGQLQAFLKVLSDNPAPCPSPQSWGGESGF
jgi:hypothetical protein